MKDTLRNVRLTARSLLRDRGFTGVAVLLLAVGIAANVTIFGVLDAVLLQPLPFAESHELVQIAETTPDGLEFSMSEPNYLDFVESQTSLVAMAAIQYASLDLTGDGEPSQLRGERVTASFFDVLGTAPALGRVFTDVDDLNVVVLSHALWRSRFGGDAEAIGSSVTLSLPAFADAYHADHPS